MDTETFNKVVEEQIEICKETLGLKEKQYAPGRDRLEQFKKGDAIMHRTPLQTLSGMLFKHTTKLYDMLEGVIKDPSLEQWNETIKDHINYLLLAKGLVVEERRINYDNKRPTII